MHQNKLSDSFWIRIVWFQQKQDSDRIRILFFKNRIGSDSKNPLSDHLWCRNHVSTWAYGNNSEIGFEQDSVFVFALAYILQYDVWIGFESEELNNFTGIWKRLTVWGLGLFHCPLRSVVNHVIVWDKNHVKCWEFFVNQCAEWRFTIRLEFCSCV